LVKLFARGKVDGIVEQRSLGSAVGRNGASARARDAGCAITASCVDFGLAHRARQGTRAVGEVLQQVDVDIERQKKGLVLGLEHALEKGAARLLFQRKNAVLAARRIEQNAQGEGQMRLGGEILDRLRRFVFVDRAIGLRKVREQVSLF